MKELACHLKISAGAHTIIELKSVGSKMGGIF